MSHKNSIPMADPFKYPIAELYAGDHDCGHCRMGEGYLGGDCDGYLQEMEELQAAGWCSHCHDQLGWPDEPDPKARGEAAPIVANPDGTLDWIHTGQCWAEYLRDADNFADGLSAEERRRVALQDAAAALVQYLQHEQNPAVIEAAARCVAEVGEPVE